MNWRSLLSSPPYLLRRPLLLVTLLYCLGILLADKFGLLGYPPPGNNFLKEGRCTFTGVVTNAPEIKPDRVTFPFEVEGRQSHAIRITVKDLTELPLVGDRLKLRGYLRIPGPPTNPGEFDYRRYLWKRHLDAILSIKIRSPLPMGERDRVRGTDVSPSSLPSPSEGRRGLGSTGPVFVNLGDSHRYPIRRLAHRTVLAITRSLQECLSPEEAALMAGLTLGIKPRAFPDVEAAFRTSGTIHVLIASGFKVAFVIGFWMFVARRGFGFPMKIALLGSVPCAVFYSFMAGGDPPVVRSCLMAIVGILGYFMAREDRAYHSLGLSALAILIWDPRSLFDLSFLMSYAGVFGLIHYSPTIASVGVILRKRKRPKNLTRSVTLSGAKGLKTAMGDPSPKLRTTLRVGFFAPLRMTAVSLLQLFATSLTAQLWLFPFYAASFHRVPLLAPISNVIAIPLSGLALPAGLVFAALEGLAGWTQLIPLHRATQCLAWCCSEIAKTLLFTAKKFAVSLWWPTLSTGWIIVYDVVLLCAVGMRRSILCRWITVLGIVALVFWPSHHADPGVTWLDVGDGSAVVIHGGHGETVLVCGSPCPLPRSGEGRVRVDVGERIILPYLADCGVKRLSAVFVGAPSSVLKTIPVDNVLIWRPGWSGRFGEARIQCLDYGISVSFGKYHVLLVDEPDNPFPPPWGKSFDRLRTVSEVEPVRMGGKHSCQQLSHPHLSPPPWKGEEVIVMASDLDDIDQRFLEKIHPSALVVSSDQPMPLFYHLIPVFCTKTHGAIYFRQDQIPPITPTMPDPD